jgi:hypothetical protein
MKTIFFCLMLVFSLQIALAQNDVVGIAADPDAPEILFETETFDYGLIEVNSPGTCSFTFKNTGKKPLVLSNVKASCGCTTPQWPKEPILPGQQGEIHVKYNTQRAGKFSKTITINSNAKTATKIIKITGEVEALPEIILPVKEEQPMVPMVK